jgi:hypothetical protein
MRRSGRRGERAPLGGSRRVSRHASRATHSRSDCHTHRLPHSHIPAARNRSRNRHSRVHTRSSVRRRRSRVGSSRRNRDRHIRRRWSSCTAQRNTHSLAPPRKLRSPRHMLRKQYRRTRRSRRSRGRRNSRSPSLARPPEPPCRRWLRQSVPRLQILVSCSPPCATTRRSDAPIALAFWLLVTSRAAFLRLWKPSLPAAVCGTRASFR